MTKTNILFGVIAFTLVLVIVLLVLKYKTVSSIKHNVLTNVYNTYRLDHNDSESNDFELKYSKEADLEMLLAKYEVIDAKSIASEVNHINKRLNESICKLEVMNGMSDAKLYLETLNEHMQPTIEMKLIEDKYEKLLRDYCVYSNKQVALKSVIEQVIRSLKLTDKKFQELNSMLVALQSNSIIKPDGTIIYRNISSCIDVSGYNGKTGLITTYTKKYPKANEKLKTLVNDLIDDKIKYTKIKRQCIRYDEYVEYVNAGYIDSTLYRKYLDIEDINKTKLKQLRRAADNDVRISALIDYLTKLGETDTKTSIYKKYIRRLSRR